MPPLLRQIPPLLAVSHRCAAKLPSFLLPNPRTRNFSATAAPLSWLIPKSGESSPTPKGRPKVHTGGSVRGTTLVWGDYGVRLADHHRRISAKQLKIGEDIIRRRLKGLNYRLYMRVSATIGVYKKGNEQRMGKGKGGFDHWACRVPVSKIIFELKGDVHEKVAQDAFRLAGDHMPGVYEFVKKGDPPMMGITKLTPEILDQFYARRQLKNTSELGQTPESVTAVVSQSVSKPTELAAAS